jgi:hypothetical protein
VLSVKGHYLNQDLGNKVTAGGGTGGAAAGWRSSADAFIKSKRAESGDPAL